ncbi:MAG: threonylcarbamoyl-AMP synthase [Candidatus Wildermuthbacteria bacterium RIFCSPLOWO2_01_FULL_48_29]|uniref:L-threonylcarbamoyladenylate synthase n=2 Tax=Candidatus Wildermuthiibacteriota TaxID=1817923 RepID=A0A1G2RMH0_9BACT|nr:MAG: threonylcarbamoyl-AMP synthase [Candidatus Wildermuthbacteria bacterium RIFCSPHIGHO2_01_FULL_48_27b]OHA73569.1 MAG: threonylcarbamoyl-AMP synthase [Candidatus Wildermuthbacteria bacterium RIFCSPLOWO2_01_FULL_48_29]
MKIVHIAKDTIEEVMREIQVLLKAGKVVACPTDTVYGLLADATNRDVVARIFQIKGREKGKPLSVFVKDIAAAKELAEISPEQELYLRDVWPGNVTVLLESRHKLPEFFQKEGKVGIRIPRHPLLNEILENFGNPLTGTSANVSGQPPCLDSKEVLAQFQEREFQPDVLLDAGKLPEARPSTVIDITKTPPEILRK